MATSATKPNQPEANIEAAIQRHGRELWERIRGERPGVFDMNYWQGHLLEWAMNDPEFKVDLFRLIDVLPALTTHDTVSAHVHEYLAKPDRKLPAIMNAAIKAASGGFGSGIAVRAFKKNVEHMAGQFIAGQDARSALTVMKNLRDQGLAFTADLLGEATVSNAEADEYQRRYLDLIDGLSKSVADWKPNPILDEDHQGPIPRANISLKVTALAPHLDPVDPEGSVRRIQDRVLPILHAARDANVFINFDLEQWNVHDITFTLFEDVANDPSLRDWPHLGIVIQAYLKTAEDDLERLLRLADQRGTPVTVRLVKGAYWDFEVVRSQQHGYPLPVFTQKAATDAQFEHLTTRLLENYDRLRPAIGSHNLRSLAHAIARAETLAVPERAWEFQTLFGMAEPERKSLAGLGHRTRVYMPLGELLPGMAYLVRRLLENTANAGFLRLTHHEGVDIVTLLEPPRHSPESTPPEGMVSGKLDTPFENCPLIDFTGATVRTRFAKVTGEWPSQFPIDVPAVINGSEHRAENAFDRPSPNDTSVVVARVHGASTNLARDAVEAASAAWPAWRDTPVEDRAQCLESLGQLLERDRVQLATLQSHEVGKPWAEADADVAEAIDFCHFYARRALVELAERPQFEPPGETNILWYEGRGPTAVIAPWNFPHAILCGMSTAALVSGNPIIMKPAEQSSAIAWSLFQRMREAGFPENVIQFLPGIGEDVGPILVNHPKIAQIAFTGSKAVGCAIYRDASAVHEGQHHLKRVVCEMGGKNAIIIDADADLDQAVKGVITSAFGYAGQKCSACSRAIVVGGVYGTFQRRLVQAARSMHQAPATDPACDLPPVVDEEAYDRLNTLISNPGDGVEVIFTGDARTGGCYVPPAIFEVTDPMHRLMREEFFGPILALHPVETFEQALDVANNVEFALTGGVFSRTPSHLDEARRGFRVGNLYLNRSITGAIVNRQPFGGFNMSGGGTKAGGANYLLNFVEPRAVTENTMRQGFTPEVSL